MTTSIITFAPIKTMRCRSFLQPFLGIFALLVLSKVHSQRVCNGLASNCDRKVNEIMYATVHNAMASLDDGFFFGYNNYQPLEDALEAGFRGLMLDSCDCRMRGIQFCHAVCFSGTREPNIVFDSVVSFMKKNPNEVVIIEIQIEDDSLWGLWEKTSTEFQSMLYEHALGTPWPTLNDLIDTDQRIIVLQHQGPNCSVKGSCPDGVHHFYDYAFQTDYDFDGADALDNYEVSCKLLTGNLTNDFFVLNHFARGSFDLPSASEGREANTKESLTARIEACEDRLGRVANLLTVDFWSVGDTLQVVDTHNARLADESASGNASGPPVPVVSSPTRAPTNPPTPTPPAPSPPSSGCFSGETTVVVKDVGITSMKNLKLGDQVLVLSAPENDVYEKVYSFGHIHHSTEMVYYQFYPSKIEISWNHMVFLEDQATPIPASLVKLGDTLRGGSEVTRISQVTRRGVYAPLTNSGTLLVNGVLASTYITFQEGIFLRIGSFATPLSFHWLAHSFQAPHRLWCAYFADSCLKETYSEQGISVLMDQPVAFSEWVVQQNAVLATTLLVPFVSYMAIVALLESIALRPTTLVAVLFSMALVRRSKR